MEMASDASGPDDPGGTQGWNRMSLHYPADPMDPQSDPDVPPPLPTDVFSGPPEPHVPSPPAKKVMRKRWPWQVRILVCAGCYLFLKTCIIPSKYDGGSQTVDANTKREAVDMVAAVDGLVGIPAETMLSQRTGANTRGW